MLKANFHTHTTFCDGKDTPEAMAEAALALGFEQLGFSGHMDPDIHMDWPAYLRHITALREQYRGRLDILCGVELDRDRAGEPVTGAEYIIGSTHFLPDADGKLTALDHSFALSEALCRGTYGGDWYKLCKAYFASEAEVVARTHCDIVGHFDLIARFNHQFPRFDENDPRYLRPAMEAMEALAITGAAFELNAGAYNRNRRNDFYPARPLLKFLHSLNAPLFINSDAHSKELLQGGFKEALAAVSACGWDHVCVLTHDENGKVVRREVPLE
ncbi:MAG: histidinol-phosphatase HisJ family protein [Clostridia bacterium]|nr:histidinol-phosphatase HisJ family protein [Clostridia bacterium]